MRAPSFRCTEEPDGSLILHYYSERAGLEHIVIGIVKVKASRSIADTNGERLKLLINLVSHFAIFPFPSDIKGCGIEASRCRGGYKNN